jgi:hypothetical protein
MVPALDARLLPDTAAVFCENCLLKAGTAQPLPYPETLHTLLPGTSFAYRFPSSYADASFLYDSTWLEFDDPDTCVVRAPVIDDQYDRYYFVSPQIPPMYNTRVRIDAGQPPYLLGVPNPTVAPIVTPPVGTVETRSYYYTWVTAFGEESGPSPPTTATGAVTGIWAITGFAPPAADMFPAGTQRQIKWIRIYRTVTNDAGATIHRVVEQLLPDTTYDDILTGAVVALNPVLPSTTWGPPPSDLHGFILAPNGYLVGWRGTQFSEVWFSEPFRPHAWVAAYTQVVEYPIVGMGITNQTIVCCTEAYPVSLQGVSPQYIEINKLVNHEPCAARGSILSGPEGVFYASPNGLVLVTPGLAENITKGIISKRNWQLLLNVPRLRAARLGMAYFAYGSVQIGIFQTGSATPAPGYNAFQDQGPPGLENDPRYDGFATEDTGGAMVGVVIDPTSDRVAFSMLLSDTPIDNCYNDPWSGEVLLVTDGKAKWLDVVSPNVDYQRYVWKSKTWQTAELRNVSAAKVFWDNVQGFSPQSYDAEPNVIRFYADERLVLTRPLDKSGELIRLPSGYKADFIRFEIEGTMRTLSVQFATTVKELSSA